MSKLTKEQKEFLETNRKLFESLIKLNKELKKEPGEIIIEKGRIVKKPKDDKKEKEEKRKRILDILDAMNEDDIEKFLNKEKDVKTL